MLDLICSETSYLTEIMKSTDLRWFRLALRVGAIERSLPGLRYSFVFESISESDENAVVKCFVYYDPERMTGVSTTLEDERHEIFLNWRNSALNIVADALKDAPEFALEISAKGQLTFTVLEGYGMGSKNVFESTSTFAPV